MTSVTLEEQESVDDQEQEKESEQEQESEGDKEQKSERRDQEQVMEGDLEAESEIKEKFAGQEDGYSYRGPPDPDLAPKVLQASRLKELKQEQLRDHLEQELKDQEEHFRGFGPETRIPGRLEISQDEDGAIVMIRKKRQEDGYSYRGPPDPDLAPKVLQASRLEELEQEQLNDHLEQELKDQEEQHFRGFGPETQIPGRLEICQNEDGAIVMIRKKRLGKPRGLDKQKMSDQDLSLPVKLLHPPLSTLPAAGAPNSSPSTTTSSPKMSVGGTSSRGSIYLLEEPPTNHIGAAKIPKTQLVLRNFFSNVLLEPTLKQNSNPLTLLTSSAVRVAAEKTVVKVLAVWEHHFGSRLIFGQDYCEGPVNRSLIMINQVETITGRIIKLVNEWKYLEQMNRRPDRKVEHQRREKLFQDKLKLPFNILKPGGEAILCASGIIDWEEEVQHLRNQLSPSQVGCCDSYDLRQQSRDNRRLKERNRQEDALRSEVMRIKEQEDAVKNEKKASQMFENQENIEKRKVGDDEDYTYEDPKLRKKKKIDIMGPISVTADARGLSYRDRTAVAASVCNTLNIPLQETNINISSSNRKARQNRVKIAAKVKEEFRCPDLVSVHWDGKILTLKGKIKSHRVAVSITGANAERVKKLLGVPECKGGTGVEEAEVVKEVLVNWDIKDQVVNLVFDTTASNSSGECGACYHLELWLDKPILWTACRHHILELHIAAVASTVWGSSTEPGVPLFRRLAKEWHSLEIDYDDLELFDFNSVPGWMDEEAKEVLKWAQQELERGTWPRCDYREFLELVVVSLGGTVEGFRFKLPGADHHARWMSKAIYYLKIWLLSRIFILLEEDRERVRRMVCFILVLYAKAWFEAPLSTSAARNDLTFHYLAIKYRQVEPQAAFKLLKCARRHQWYTTPQMVTLALADTGLVDGEREELAKSIHILPRTVIKSGRPDFPVLDWRGEELARPRLASLTTSDSWLLFQMLQLEGTQVSRSIRCGLLSIYFRTGS